MNSFIFKLILSSFLIILAENLFAASISDLIQQWKRNDYLIFSAPVKYDRLEPILSLNAHTKLTLPLIFEPLISIASQQELQPVLAKSWSISSDNKSIQITIQPHHYFSDQTEVSAQDVVNSILRVCKPGSQVSSELKGLSGCQENSRGTGSTPEIKAVGKYQVEFKINCSPTTFLYQLSSPNVVITKETKNGLIGSGPYTVEDTQNNYIVLKPNLFVRKENKPRNSGVVIFYANQNKVANILRRDKHDGALMYRIEDIWSYKDDSYKLEKINPVITEILVLNNQNFPFNRAPVRKALSSAIYNNFKYKCIPGAHKAYGIIPYGLGGSIDNTPPSKLPIITPSELFKEIPELTANKVIVTIHQLDDLKKDCESNQIIVAAKPYNIDIRFKYHKSYSTLEPLYMNHKLDGFIELYVFRNREAYSVLQFFTKTGENNANIKDSYPDKMLQEAITAPSSHGRFQSYRKMAQHLQDKSIVIPLFYMDHGNVLSKCLSGTSDNFLFNPFIYIPQLYRKKDCTIN